MSIQVKGRDEEKRNLSENISEERNVHAGEAQG
jgi:hypothetical protein